MPRSFSGFLLDPRANHDSPISVAWREREDDLLPPIPRRRLERILRKLAVPDGRGLIVIDVDLGGQKVSLGAYTVHGHCLWLARANWHEDSGIQAVTVQVGPTAEAASR